MARRVFFSFHYQQDIWRVSQVRNSWLLQKGETNTFMDTASWESVKKRGPTAIKSWINRQLSGTGVTVVLIGQHTALRRYVLYEIEESYRRGNGLLGIHIHRLKNSKGLTSSRGSNPLDAFTVEVDDPLFGFLGYKSKQKLSQIFLTYDWVWDNGRKNMGNWIEDAAKKAGRQ